MFSIQILLTFGEKIQGLILSQGCIVYVHLAVLWVLIGNSTILPQFKHCPKHPPLLTLMWLYVCAWMPLWCPAIDWWLVSFSQGCRDRVPISSSCWVKCKGILDRTAGQHKLRQQCTKQRCIHTLIPKSIFVLWPGSITKNGDTRYTNC